VGALFQGLSLRQVGDGFLDHGIPVGLGAQTLQLAKLDGEDLALMLALIQSIGPLKSSLVQAMFWLVRNCLNS
jgi:hypothetical protein